MITPINLEEHNVEMRDLNVKICRVEASRKLKLTPDQS